MTQNIEIDLKTVRNNKSIVITIILLILFVLAVFYSLISGGKYSISEADKDQNNSKTWKRNIQRNESEPSKALDSPQTKIEERKTNLEEPQNVPEKSVLSQKPIKGISDYRNYLYNANDLIVKFLEDRDYQTQINQVQTIELPSEITEILLSMEYYREHYLLDRVDTIRIFPITGSWLEKFIKIEKKSDITIQKEKLKAEIIANLKLLTEYFYSVKLQQEFVE